MFRKLNLTGVFIFCLSFLFFANSSIDQDSILDKGYCLLEKVRANPYQNYDANIAKLKEAIAYFEQTEEWEMYIDAMNDLSASYYYKGDMENASDNASFAYKEAKKYLHKKNQKFINAAYNRATFLDIQGCHDDAIIVIDELLEIEAKLVPKVLWSIALNYNFLGISYRNIGDYNSAIDNFKQSIDLMTDTLGANNIQLAPLWSDLAKAYKLSGQDEKAIEAYQHCAAVVAKNEIKEDDRFLQQNILYCHQDMAKIYLERNQLDSTSYFIHKALKLQKKYKGFIEAYKSYELLGKIYFKQKKYQKAIRYLKKAQLILTNENEGIKKDANQSRILREIATIQLVQKEYDGALDSYQKALQSLSMDFEDNDIYTYPPKQKTFNKREVANVFAGKANAFFEYYKHTNELSYLEEAYKNYVLASEIIPLVREDYQADESKYQLAKEMHSVYENGIKLAALLFDESENKDYLHQAFRFSEESKGILLQEKLQENKLKGQHILPDKLLKQDRQLRAKINYYEEELYKVKSTAAQNELAPILRTLKSNLRIFNQKIEKDYPIYTTLKNANYIRSVSTIQNSLNDRTALIKYFIGEKDISIFCITNEEFEVFQEANSKELKAELEQLKVILANHSGEPEEYEKYHKVAYHLYNEFLEVPISCLGEAVNRLILIPDGQLHHIPFEALLVKPPRGNKDGYYSNKNLHYLLEDFSISYGYSASLKLLAEKQKKQDNIKPFLGIAPNENLNAEAEVRTITKRFKGDVLINEEATLATVLKKIEDYFIVHFHTHAKKNTVNPNLNQIELFDSLLLSNRLEQSHLGAALAFIATCESADGKNIEGEGVMSLARSFFLAGCPSIVASLWEVENDYAKKITQDFYEHLANGKTKDEALRQAKLEYLKDGDRFHPSFWAPFILVGNAESLDIPKRSSFFSDWLFMLFGSLLILGVIVIRIRK